MTFSEFWDDEKYGPAYSDSTITRREIARRAWNAAIDAVMDVAMFKWEEGDEVVALKEERDGLERT